MFIAPGESCARAILESKGISMEPSKVYFCDMRTKNGVSLPDKLRPHRELRYRFRSAAAQNITAPGSAFLRKRRSSPIHLWRLSVSDDSIRCIPGRRKNALSIWTAAENASAMKHGAHRGIGDGLKGRTISPFGRGGIRPRGEDGPRSGRGYLLRSTFQGTRVHGLCGALKNIGMAASRAPEMETQQRQSRRQSE